MMQLTMLAAILPLEVKRRHLSQTVAGIIMGSFCFAWFFIPTFTIEKLFPLFGRKGSARLGTLVLALYCVLLWS